MRFFWKIMSFIFCWDIQGETYHCGHPDEQQYDDFTARMERRYRHF